MTLEEHMFCVIKNYLNKYGNNPTDVAKRLGISRATIYRYMKEMNY
jgi:transcriptional regulator with PAS, ATPase and Fis domain